MYGKSFPTLFFTSAVLAAVLAAASSGGAQQAETPDWSLNATLIEACSCPMFCQCYFNTKPAAHGHHGEEHFCRFNNVFQVNRGHFGDVRLDGAKFWVAGDLGGDFAEGKMDWATLIFDPAVTEKQREGVLAALPHLYPVEWQSFSIGEDRPVEWKGGKDQSVALLDGGRSGEVRLVRYQGMTDEPIVIQNLVYWGAPRNDGFVLMPNEINAFRLGDKAFEFRGTNGFMITVDIAAKDVAQAR